MRLDDDSDSYFNTVVAASRSVSTLLHLNSHADHAVEEKFSVLGDPQPVLCVVTKTLMVARASDQHTEQTHKIATTVHSA